RSRVSTRRCCNWIARSRRCSPSSRGEASSEASTCPTTTPSSGMRCWCAPQRRAPRPTSRPMPMRSPRLSRPPCAPPEGNTSMAMLKHPEKIIFEYSRPGRGSYGQWPTEQRTPPTSGLDDIPANLRRKSKPLLPEVSELEVVRHFTKLSQLNFSIDTHFYPLGSCTMKYNPKACNQYAMLPGFLNRHPLAPEPTGQGFLACMYELQEMLKEVTGMQGVALSPMAGAHGEFAGVAMIRAYHRARGDLARNEIIVPVAAHGTNPATATMCGCVVREIPVNDEGDVDVDALRAAVGPNTAGIM